MDASYTDLSTFTSALSSIVDSIPTGSNSFYNIGDGLLNLYQAREIAPYIFMVYTESGTISTGPDMINVSRDQDSLYGTLTVKAGTKVVVDDSLIIDNSIVEIHGVVKLLAGSKVLVSNESDVIFYSDSTLQVDLNDYYSDLIIPSINVGDDATLKIYGNINITLPDNVPSEDPDEIRELKLAALDSIINNPNIYIDSAAHINVTNLIDSLNLGERETSLTDYEYTLRNKVINIHTQGETNTHTGRIGYVWKDGSIATASQILQMLVLWGEAVLGDFKLSILGKQREQVPNLQVLESFHVMKNTTLYISELFTYDSNTYRYIRPELYLGRIIDNCDTPGSALVDGTIIVDGATASITIDREATLTISQTGTIKLQNGAVLRSAYNKNKEVLTINGTLIVDYIEQLQGFNSNNIVFGEKGKLVIINPTSDEYRLLWSTPNGIKSTQLYELFENALDHIEYHISENTGIRIDQYYEFFGRDMIEWYNNMRIEKAIHEGLVVWHDGGCIELDSDIIPWVSHNSTLLEAARLFKSYGSYDTDKLQEVVARLNYAGAGNIVFKFIDRNTNAPDILTHEVTLNLEGVKVKSVVHKPTSTGSEYEVDTDNDGVLFMQNLTSGVDNIIDSKSKMYSLQKGSTIFDLGE